MLYCFMFYVNVYLDVFSESTARGLEYYSKDHPAFMETARYVKFISNIWKIMSVKSPFKGMFLHIYHCFCMQICESF